MSNVELASRDILDRPSQGGIPLGLLEDSSLVALESHRSLGRARTDQNGFHTDFATRRASLPYPAVSRGETAMESWSRKIKDGERTRRSPQLESLAAKSLLALPGVVSVIHDDHIKPVNAWIKEGQVPAFTGSGKGKKPNAAMRRINRIENQQWMLWRANMYDKKGHWDEDMAAEWTEYQKCFYDARNMRESNVLKRTYRPLATILRLVRAWAEARKTSTADWHPIGVKARSHAPSKIGAYL